VCSSDLTTAPTTSTASTTPTTPTAPTAANQRFCKPAKNRTTTRYRH